MRSQVLLEDKGDNSGVCNLEKTHAFCFATRSYFCFNFSAQLSSLFMNSLWTFPCPKLDNYHKPSSKCKRTMQCRGQQTDFSCCSKLPWPLWIFFCRELHSLSDDVTRKVEAWQPFMLGMCLKNLAGYFSFVPNHKPGKHHKQEWVSLSAPKLQMC